MIPHKGFIVPLIIFILAALALGGGVYVYTSSKLSSTSAPQAYTTSTATQVASWITYTNLHVESCLRIHTKEGGFVHLKNKDAFEKYSIQYPPGAQVEEEVGADVPCAADLSKGTLYQDKHLLIAYGIDTPAFNGKKVDSPEQALVSAKAILATLAAPAASTTSSLSPRYTPMESPIDPTVTYPKSLVYRNTKYGFELTLPKPYDGYSVDDPSFYGTEFPGHRLDFYVDASGTVWPTETFVVFNITMYPIDFWNKNVRVDEKNYAWDKGYSEDFSLGSYLGKNTNYAFVWQRGQDCPGSKTDKSNIGSNTPQCDMYQHVSDVMSTFAILE